MIKWVMVLVHIPTGNIVGVKECGDPIRDKPTDYNLNPENDPQYRQKTFCIECDEDINADWLRANLEDDGQPNSMPLLKAGLPTEVAQKVQRRITVAEGDLDYDDRRLAYQQLALSGEPITAEAILSKVDEIRAQR